MCRGAYEETCVAEIELTLHEAADVLGVHYMTAYRYVRLGLLDAVKVGGTWRVAQADIEAFRSGAAIAGAVGVAPVVAGSRRRAPWAERLEQRLTAGDAQGAWGVVEAALAAGADLEEIYLEVLSPAMTSIGARWAKGELDIAVEHRASGIAMRLIGRLGPRFARRGRTRGVVVVGAPPGERHSLPIAILADLVRQAGWEVSDLGADVPTASLAHVIVTSGEVVAVGLSVSGDDHLDAAQQAVAAVREAAPLVHVVLGGMAITGRDHALALGAHDFAADGNCFVAILEALGREPTLAPPQ
jgi:excisionase family DNA binding protein